MKSLLAYISSYCSCCLHCGSLFVREALLCRKCHDTLSPRKSDEKPRHFPFVVRALYNWRPGESDMLSSLVLALKGSRQRRHWTYYAQVMAQRASSTLPPGRKICVVPAPAKRVGQKDHAYHWGTCLAEALGATFLPCLEKVPSSQDHAKQREKDRGERALLEMAAHVNYSEMSGFLTDPLIIFADDILTTGATARAAYQALGSPPHFEVWVLSERGLSCGASKDLL